VETSNSQQARVRTRVVLSHWQAARLIIELDQYDYQARQAVQQDVSPSGPGIRKVYQVRLVL
jgi:hypothetical protein